MCSWEPRPRLPCRALPHGSWRSRSGVVRLGFPLRRRLVQRLELSGTGEGVEGPLGLKETLGGEVTQGDVRRKMKDALKVGFPETRLVNKSQ